MIYLYHGTDAEIGLPDPKRGRRGMDFGQGFYLTPNFESAKRMAEEASRRTFSDRSMFRAYGKGGGFS